LSQEGLLRCWIVTLGFLTILILATPLQVAGREMVFTLLLLVLVLANMSKEGRIVKYAILFSGLYWLSNVIPGIVGSILSYAGIGFAFIVALVFANKFHKEEESLKASS